MGSREDSIMRKFIVCTVHPTVGVIRFSRFNCQNGRSAFKIVTGKPTGKGPLESPRGRWEDNIRIDLKRIGINTRNRIGSASAKKKTQVSVDFAS